MKNNRIPFPPLIALLLLIYLTPLAAQKYPVVDVHTHIDAPLTETLKIMDRLGIERLINLNGKYGEHLINYIERYQIARQQRVLVAMSTDYTRIDDVDFLKNALQEISRAHARGVRFYKVYKSLGLYDRDSRGKLIRVDDPRLNPLWRRLGELEMTVIIHTADPDRFWQPPGPNNYIERPEWSFFGKPVPPKDSLMMQLERVIRRHPETRFVVVHFGCWPENLAFLSHMMQTYPNYFIDTAARIGELGRRPEAARQFIVDYSDRILFGTDFGLDSTATVENTLPWAKEFYNRHFRFLETLMPKIPTPFDGNMGKYNVGENLWAIDGIQLPDSVLAKLYSENAKRILGL